VAAGWGMVHQGRQRVQIQDCAGGTITASSRSPLFYPAVPMCVPVQARRLFLSLSLLCSPLVRSPPCRITASPPRPRKLSSSLQAKPFGLGSSPAAPCRRHADASPCTGVHRPAGTPRTPHHPSCSRLASLCTATASRRPPGCNCTIPRAVRHSLSWWRPCTHRHGGWRCGTDCATHWATANQRPRTPATAAPGPWRAEPPLRSTSKSRRE
jgi:hypothetical protein